MKCLKCVSVNKLWYHSWSVKRPNIFMWLSFSKGYGWGNSDNEKIHAIQILRNLWAQLFVIHWQSFSVRYISNHIILLMCISSQKISIPVLNGQLSLVLSCTYSIILIIIHKIYNEKADWSRAFNQYTIVCEVDMIKCNIWGLYCIYLLEINVCLVSKTLEFSVLNLLQT